MYLVFSDVFSVDFSQTKNKHKMYKKNFCKNNLPFCRNNPFLHLGEVQKLRQDVEVLLNLKTADVFSLVSAETKMFFLTLSF